MQSVNFAAPPGTDPFDAWRPVLLSRKLGSKPVEIMLNGREIVLFREAGGAPRALANRCPHRQMRLALGKVEGDQLVCPYHGWRFRGDGGGSAPGTPGMHIATTCYQVREQHGALWLRSGGLDEVPAFDFPGYRSTALLHHPLAAPLHLLLDNMMELEHSASVHSLFGFAPERMHEVATSTSVDDERTHIFYQGPQRKLPPHLQLFSGIREGDTFIQDADVMDQPIHAAYDLSWRAPGSQVLRGLELKFVIYFNEVAPGRAEQFTFAWFKCDSPLRTALFSLVRRVMAFHINQELAADIALVESLRLGPGQEDNYLFDRFDRPLAARRKRLAARAPAPSSTQQRAAQEYQ